MEYRIEWSDGVTQTVWADDIATAVADATGKYDGPARMVGVKEVAS